jgi:hypothetical protein
MFGAEDETQGADAIQNPRGSLPGSKYARIKTETDSSRSVGKAREASASG